MDERTTSNHTTPLMSREFLSADDAARHAHEQVGEQRDRQFLAMIFKRGNQRFVVTEPVEAGDHLLEKQLFPLDPVGRAVYPQNHVLHSLFYSHPALSTLDVARIERLKWSRLDATVSLQMFSVHELFHIVMQSTPAYLSGAEDSLLWFEPDPVGWQRLLQRLGTADNPGALATGLEQGGILPVDYVREVSAAGELRVVIDNPLWGYRTRVGLTWSPYTALGERPVPRQVSCGAVFSSPDEAAGDRFIRGMRLPDQQQTWFGFILKHQGKEEYVATELVAVDGVRDKLFSQRSLFVQARDGQYVMPEDFARHSYFYSRQRVTHDRANRVWLAEHFIVPRDLFVVVYDSRRPPVIEGRGSIPLYIATQDGALLKYVMRHNSKLFDIDTPTLTLDFMQSNLASGKLSSTGFVRVVANSGELSVLHSNHCWDRLGRIDSDWQPARHLERRVLGAVFPTADDAVMAARDEVPAHSPRTWGGLVLRRADGLFVATRPLITLQENFDIDWIFPDESVSAGLFPAGCSIVARYRSRSSREVPMVLPAAQKQLYLNMLSVDSVYTAFQRGEKVMDEYLFGPDGSVIRYRCGRWDRMRADLANVLSDYHSLPHDLDASWIRKRLHEGDLTPVEWVDSLAKNGDLQVVAGSAVWGRPRAVSEFGSSSPRPSVLSSVKATRDPRHSPVYAQESAAARHAHEQAGNRGLPLFGFLLNNERQRHFISTLPLSLLSSSLDYDRVFPEGQPLTGYKVSGVYLCAAQNDDDRANRDLAYFFTPTAVHLLLARAKQGQAYLPVYLSCADGALLRYQMDPFEPGPTLDQFGQSALISNKFASPAQVKDDERKIRLGTYSLSDYIQHMVRAGKLEVLVPSAFWGKGVVGRDWLPHWPGMSEQELWGWKPELAMGPVFHHADDAARYIQQRAGSGYAQTTYESAIVTQPGKNSFCGLEPLPHTGVNNAMIDRIFRTASDPTTNRRNKTPRFAPGYELMGGHQLYLSGTNPVVADEERVAASFVSPWMVYLHTHALRDKGFHISTYYYSTPHGALLKYVPSYSKMEKELLTTRQAELVGGRWVTKLGTADFISRLAELGELRVLKAAFFWNRTGRLGEQWKTSRHQIPMATVKFQRDEL